MIASNNDNQNDSFNHLYPIVVELDDETRDHGAIGGSGFSNGFNNNGNGTIANGLYQSVAGNALMYNAFASEASWQVCGSPSERSWIVCDDENDENDADDAVKGTSKARSPGNNRGGVSPTQQQQRHRNRKRGSRFFRQSNDHDHCRYDATNHDESGETTDHCRPRDRDENRIGRANGNEDFNDHNTNDGDKCGDNDNDNDATVQKKHHKRTSSGRVFANLLALLQRGSNGSSNNNNKHHHRRSKSIDFPVGKHNSNNDTATTLESWAVSPELSPVRQQSPVRVLSRKNRLRWFHDEYVLTQEIVRCRVAILWECVHRPTGRRYCAKAIDKRRFASRSDRAMAVREITMYRLIQQQALRPPGAEASSPSSQHHFPLPSCLPRIRDVFADEEASEAQQQHDGGGGGANEPSWRQSSSSSTFHSAIDDPCSSSSSNHDYWYIVQDFEAGGGNLEVYLMRRENAAFEKECILAPPAAVLFCENNDPKIHNNNNRERRGVVGGSPSSYPGTTPSVVPLSRPSRASANTLQESRARLLARSLLLALNELHQRSICHNDLCPENILIPLSDTTNNNHNDSSNGHHRCSKSFCFGDGNDWNELKQEKQETRHHRNHHLPHPKHESSSGENCWEGLKLCDLGRSFVVESPSNHGASASGDPTSIPRHGSLYYTSPEVLLGKPPCLASDVWSVGVILYRCFSGELPFKGQTNDSASVSFATGKAFSVPSMLSQAGLAPTDESSPSSSSAAASAALKRRRMQLKREICKAACNLGQKRSNNDLKWSRVSRGAKQFLSSLLNPDPKTRTTCREALSHPWMLAATTTTMPMMPSSTSTNHYRHHPLYPAMLTPTAAIISKREDRSVPLDTDIGKIAGPGSASSPADCSGGSEIHHHNPLRSPGQQQERSFVHRFLGRFKTTTSNNNPNNTCRHTRKHHTHRRFKSDTELYDLSTAADSTG